MRKFTLPAWLAPLAGAAVRRGRWRWEWRGLAATQRKPPGFTRAPGGSDG